MTNTNIEQQNKELIEKCQQLEEQINDLTVWLYECYKILYDSESRFQSIALKQWFLEYDSFTKEQEQMYENILLDKKVRDSALSKLTDEEKRVLKLPR